MYIQDIFMKIVSQGETISTKELQQLDTEHTYVLHTFYVLGGYNEVARLTLNGIENIVFGGTTKYDTTPINTLTVNTSVSGVLVIGKKIKKKIF
jgi:hypothetical protein